MKQYVIIVAGGKGERMNSSVPKQFLELRGKPILMHTIERFYIYRNSIKIILVLPEQQINFWHELCDKHQFYIQHDIVKGGEERFFSVKNGLSLVEKNSIVAIHDGVRPLVSIDAIHKTYVTASEKGNAIPAIPVKETIRYVNGQENKVVDRMFYFKIQTPQCFKSDIILKAYQNDYNPKFTDDSSVLEVLDIKINLIEGNEENIKITTQQDLLIAESLLVNNNM